MPLVRPRRLNSSAPRGQMPARLILRVDSFDVDALRAAYDEVYAYTMSRPGFILQHAGEETQSSGATNGAERPASTNRLMEEVCERENLKAALRQVRANKGSPGVEGMTVVGLTDQLKQHWPAIREQLLSGTYEPQPVRRVEIPKPGGGGGCKVLSPLLDEFWGDRYGEVGIRSGSSGQSQRTWKT